MNVVGKVGSLISQGVYSVATPLHPFGGAVDVIVVQQEDGTYRSTPWYVRFGKFQGVLKGAEKIVSISVNGIDAPFHMYLDNSGQAYFMHELPSISQPVNNETESVISESFREESIQEEKDDEEDEDEESNYEFREEENLINKYESLDEMVKESTNGSGNSEVVLVSIDGHVLTAPIRSTEEESVGGGNLDFGNPQFHLGPGESSSGDFGGNLEVWEKGFLGDLDVKESHRQEMVLVSEEEKREVVIEERDGGKRFEREEVEKFKSCVDLTAQIGKEEDVREERECEEREVEVKEEVDETAEEREREEREVEVKDEIDENTEEREVEVKEEGDETTKERESEEREVEIKDEIDETTEERESEIKEEIDETEVRESEVMEEIDETTEERESVVSESAERKLEGEETGEDEERKSVVSESPKVVNQMELEVPESPKILTLGCEISTCGNLLKPNMGHELADQIFKSHQISVEEFTQSGPSILKNPNLIIKIENNYFPYSKSAHLILGRAVFGPNYPIDPKDSIPVEEIKENDNSNSKGIMVNSPSSSSRRWRLWPIPFRMSRSLQRTNSTDSTEDLFLDSEPFLNSPNSDTASECNNGSVSSKIGSGDKEGYTGNSPRKQFVRTNLPTNEQIALLSLKEGQNMVTFSFSTRVLGKQQVDAHIYLWKWNAKIVISDVDGTITKSDVLGQFMPLVGKDWTQSGVARLFCAIKENGYQLLFLSARAIVQAYLTRNFLNNLKQDGKALPNGPVVISPDGLFPSLYREVIRRAPHEFKIACLEDIKALFPSDYNPFYAGFGNRDTDELSYRKIGIPKGKIFIINPKGEVAINNCTDVKSYTSLHTLVNDMFPPTSLVEQEDFNAWNYWKMPLPSID